MFKLICVTNRTMCRDIAERAGKLYKNGVDVILREKDLSEEEYKALARRVMNACPNVILHTYANAARELGADRIHMPFSVLTERPRFGTVGTSIHSVAEAVKAEKLGVDYVTAGHIFSTDCKKGLEPRGLDFLRDVVNAVRIPVYAIGGISPDNIGSVRETGAAGACVMSGFMRCGDVSEYIDKLKG